MILIFSQLCANPCNQINRDLLFNLKQDKPHNLIPYVEIYRSVLAKPELS